jgi:ABC-type nickel/cobalt efflux system permease component RcnA
MDGSLVLVGTAVSVGVVHTLLGPDHYLPFIAMSRIGNWSRRKTLLVTLGSGVAHVLSSALLGGIGLLLGLSALRLEAWEAVRGDVAGWMLLAFGAAYLAWGLRTALRRRPHTHAHRHDDGTLHAHPHGHEEAHAHAHTAPFVPGVARAGRLTPWVLFTIFIFGPCEPLIPVLMFPAFAGNPIDVLWVVLAFGGATLATMTALVFAGRRLTEAVSAGPARFGHAAAGLVLTACGVAVVLGL